MIDCKVCDGSGFIVDTDKRETVACECRPQRIAERKARRLSTVIPKLYRDVAFERNPIVTMDPFVVRLVKNYVDDLDANLEAGRGLWLEGERTGTGKTSLAMLVTKIALERRHTAAIYSVPRLLGALRATFNDDSQDTLTGMIDALIAVDLLQLDDLGAERQSEWVLEQLYTIVNARYEEQRAIVVTTNLPAERLAEQIGERTVSRLMEICGEIIPIHDEVDHRREFKVPTGALRYGELPS